MNSVMISHQCHVYTSEVGEALAPPSRSVSRSLATGRDPPRVSHCLLLLILLLLLRGFRTPSFVSA